MCNHGLLPEIIPINRPFQDLVRTGAEVTAMTEFVAAASSPAPCLLSPRAFFKLFQAALLGFVRVFYVYNPATKRGGMAISELLACG
jgi:hypothetical protein